MKNIDRTILYIGSILIMGSCVSNKKYQEALAQRNSATDEIAKLKVSNDFQDYELSDVRYSKAMALDSLSDLFQEENTKLEMVANKLKRALGRPLPEGITISIGSDNLMVNLDEEVLFSVGQKDLNEKGRRTLTGFAQAFLSNNPDMTLMVVGHTDNLAYNSHDFDNWDLSTQRSLSVVRLLHEQGVDPKQLIAAGRSQYNPVRPNTSAGNRKLNRRIEIILKPLVSQLHSSLEALSSN